jgi:phospholipid/cholesterol/gamma-HCH transport system ATP-binding protein
MKKRAALARALALDPKLLFCDEPTAGLDPTRVTEFDELTLGLCRDLGVTAVVVTHDMTSAFRIATRMILLNKGKVWAEGNTGENSARIPTRALIGSSTGLRKRAKFARMPRVI